MCVGVGGGGVGVCVPETDWWVHCECFMCVMSVIMCYKCVCVSETDWWVHCERFRCVMSVIMYYKCVCVCVWGGGGSVYQKLTGGCIECVLCV